MRKKSVKPLAPEFAVYEALPAQPSPVEAWRYSPTPPTIDPETGEHVGLAEDWKMDPATLPWMIIRCDFGCRDLIATRSLKRDICESCAYRIRDAAHERDIARNHRVSNRIVNPFASHDEFREMGGSLPSVSGPKR
jgi:hypothetical protein